MLCYYYFHILSLLTDIFFFDINFILLFHLLISCDWDTPDFHPNATVTLVVKHMPKFILRKYARNRLYFRQQIFNGHRQRTSVWLIT